MPSYCRSFDLENFHVPFEIKRTSEKKLANFYKDISKRSEKDEMMRLQTDQEFQQNEVEKLNSKFNVKMFSSKVRGEKAFAAEQKNREFKKLLFKRKKIH